MISTNVWIGFVTLVIAMMTIDLGLFNRRDHIPSAKEAIRNTLVWIVVAMLFGGFVYWAYDTNWQGLGTYAYEPMDGYTAWLKYLTGYLLEESLSVDNLFVIALIFTRFKIPKMYQHKVLFWGILGVLVFRGILIAVGTELIHAFQWLFYVFGGLLMYSAYKLYSQHDDDLLDDDIDQNKTVKLIRRFYPVSTKSTNGHFFVEEDGRRAMTLLMVALLVVEVTDVVFAFDSVPAVLSITTDPFLVFSSNVFAIMGLRSLYFVLADFLDRFSMLKYSLMAILLFIGIKMVLIPLHIHVPTGLSLGLIAVSLGAGVWVSMRNEKKNL